MVQLAISGHSFWCPVMPYCPVEIDFALENMLLMCSRQTHWIPGGLGSGLRTTSCSLPRIKSPGGFPWDGEWRSPKNWYISYHKIPYDVISVLWKHVISYHVFVLLYDSYKVYKPYDLISYLSMTYCIILYYGVRLYAIELYYSTIILHWNICC